MTHPKRIGFLSFGHWHPHGGMTRTPGDALRQTVELAVAAEELGIDGAFVRVHHFARQLASPFPLLAAIGVSTQRIEIGTGVIDMRYEKPALHGGGRRRGRPPSGGRLQLGVSRGSPEPAWRGAEAFGSGHRRGGRAPEDRAASGPRSPARVSSPPTAADGRRRRCCPSSRSHRASPTGSGGAPARATPPSGPPSRA